MADTGIRQWGGRLYWRGGIFQRRRNLFSKIINGGGGGGVQSAYDGGGGGGGVQSAYDGGGGCSPLRRGGGGVQSLTTYTSAPPPIRLGGPRPPLPPRFLRLCILERALLPPSTCDEQSIAN